MNIQVGEELPREANIHTNRALDTANVFILDPEAAARDEVIHVIRKAKKLRPSLCYMTHLGGGAHVYSNRRLLIISKE